jgi:hypothetical protein
VIMRKSSHMSQIKLHNINSKPIIYNCGKNYIRPNILIKSSSICTKLRIIRSRSIIVIFKELASPSPESQAEQESWGKTVEKLAHVKLLKSKTTHIHTHVSDPVSHDSWFH